MAQPALTGVAVVAAPDDRTGEHGHAFVRVKPGQPAPSLDDVKKHLQQVDLARPKWPEVIEVVQDFPRTPSGKVRKVDLRNQVRAAAKS